MRNTSQPSGKGFGQLQKSAQAFIAVVVFSGLMVIGYSVYALCSAPVTSQWFLLAALTLLSGSVTVKLPSVPATLSVSETFVFTSVLLFGPAAGTITVTLDGLIISLWLTRNRLEFHKLLFNTTAPALSIWVAAEIFFRLTGASPLNNSATSITPLLPGLLVFALTYFLLNSWLMATAVSFEEALTPLQVWRQNFLWLSLTFFSGASVSILLVSISREVNLSALAVIVPLLIISYLTYHTSMGRVEDANRHVDNLNKLYLSTIETLAMAIDAKDQVTHGHIRRVQEHSVALARHLGVNDDRLIKAVEAASLLHDMGKLAIPEHILNKPGKLTTAEFDLMKTHASVGADLLAAIEFPYPVVPIVRHHHENWDGSGYPDGLSGTDIPVGARILSVVDCFDALTSDRPYRPRLTFDEAMAILRDRRGTMYDPLVVDSFIKMTTDTIFVGVNSMGHDINIVPGTWSNLWNGSKTPAMKFGVRLHVKRQLFPYNIEVLADYLTRDGGARLVFFVPDAGSCDLVVAKAWGSDTGDFARLRGPIGKGLSGSVAAGYNPVFDTDPARNFVNWNGISPALIDGCDAMPICVGNEFVGVLTLYRNAKLYSAEPIEQGLMLLSEQISSYFASQVLSTQTAQRFS